MNTETKVLLAIAAVITVAMSALLIVRAGDSDSKDAEVADAGKLVREDSIQSNPDASVTVVEFGDFQCPACAAAHPEVKVLMEEYGDRVNFVWRQFPLAIHQNAEAAANAAEAAEAAGKFYPYQNVLFTNQRAWSESSGGALVDLFAEYGAPVGVDGNAITTAVNDKQYQAKIDRDVADGNALSVNSTPTFFVQGKQVAVSELRQAIADALKQ